MSSLAVRCLWFFIEEDRKIKRKFKLGLFLVKVQAIIWMFSKHMTQILGDIPCKYVKIWKSSYKNNVRKKKLFASHLGGSIHVDILVGDSHFEKLL